MLVSLTRIIKYGIQGFLRNSWLSISTISIMILTLVVFEGLILFNFMGKQAVKSIQEKVDISVYFKSNVPEDSVLSVKRSLEGLVEVASVKYVSREEALKEFKKRHAKDDAIMQTLKELNDNPLLASLNVKAKELSQYSAIASYLETPSLTDLIERVTYTQNQVIIDRLSKIVKTLNDAIVMLTIILAFLAIIVTFNTIRLAIFASSEEISIMRLVGASNAFIKGPFIVEGIIYGIIAAVVGFLIYVPVIQIISPSIANFVGGISIDEYLAKNWLSLLGYQLLFAIVLSSVSSSIATRRYLKK